MSVPGKIFQPNLMFEGKARNFLHAYVSIAKSMLAIFVFAINLVGFSMVGAYPSGAPHGIPPQG